MYWPFKSGGKEAGAIRCSVRETHNTLVTLVLKRVEWFGLEKKALATQNLAWQQPW